MGRFKRLGVWIVLAALAIAGYAVYRTPLVQERLIAIPDERDPKLYGGWTAKLGVAKDGSKVMRLTILSSDGSGQYSINDVLHEPFTWGTRGGTLYAKYQKSGTWVSPHFAYSLSPDGDTLTFQGVTPDAIVHPTMKRLKLMFQRVR